MDPDNNVSSQHFIGTWGGICMGRARGCLMDIFPYRRLRGATYYKVSLLIWHAIRKALKRFICRPRRFYGKHQHEPRVNKVFGLESFQRDCLIFRSSKYSAALLNGRFFFAFGVFHHATPGRWPWTLSANGVRQKAHTFTCYVNQT